MNLIQTLEKEQMQKLSAGKDMPDFGPGDTLLVNVKIVEGERTRVQAYEGVCIGRSGAGLHENFTVRKISYGEGVERVFPLYSPMVDSIKVIRHGKVRRAKLYYLRGLRGTAFDPFGYSAERKTERALLRDYEAMLEEILGKLTPENHHIAVGLAAIPEKIRGFGHVKMRHLKAAKADEAALLDQFRSGPAPLLKAAE